MVILQGITLFGFAVLLLAAAKIWTRDSGWRRFLRRALGLPLQYGGAVLLTTGLYPLVRAGLGWSQNGVWAPTTLGQALIDDRYSYPETGRWLLQGLPTFVADIPFSVILIVVGLAMAALGMFILMSEPPAKRASAGAAKQDSQRRSPHDRSI